MGVFYTDVIDQAVQWELATFEFLNTVCNVPVHRSNDNLNLNHQLSVMQSKTEATL